MLELDEVVRQNQLNYLPISKSGRAEAELYERYPALADRLERSKDIKVDQVRLQSRMRERESKIGGALKTKGDQLEDFEPSLLARKLPSQPSKDISRPSKSPSLKAKKSAADLMFAMEYSDESDGEEPTRHSSAPRGRAAKADQSPAFNPTMSPGEGAYGRIPEVGEIVSPSASYQALESLHRQTVTSSLEEKPSSRRHQPWATGAITTSKLDMKDIMAQASGNRTSNISTALAMRAKESKSPGLPPKLSQRERRKQQQQQQQLQAQSSIALESASNPTHVLEVQGGPGEKSASPWQSTLTGPKVSLKEVIGAERSSPLAKMAVVSPRTPSPMTLRQTVAGKPPARRTNSGSAQGTTISPRRTSSNPSTSISPGQNVLSPPRSISTYNPTIQSIRHVTPPAVEPSLQLSMSDILSQQQTEKEIIKEAAAKRSLQEIQEEQAFQEWWDQESRKVQEKQEASAKPQSARGEKAGRGNGRGGSRNRGRGKERGSGEGSSGKGAAQRRGSGGGWKEKEKEKEKAKTSTETK